MWKDLSIAQWLDKTLALLNRYANADDAFLDDYVSGSARGDIKRLQNGNAGRQQRRERPREAGDGDLQKDRADDGRLKQQSIDSLPALRRLVVEVQRY